MAALHRARMDELCELVTDGTHDSPKLQKEGVPFIKGKHISRGKINFELCDFITQEDHELACRRVKPQRGDILFSNIGSVGDTAVVRDDREFSIKNVALFRPDVRRVDSRYFYYLVLSPEFHSNVMNVRSGSAQPFITLASLRAFEINYLPRLPIQRRIAGILSAYDDLIENSQRRIKILESMARALYREWFVHFRFPGHESVPRVPSTLGEIPQGWEVRRLPDCVEVNPRVPVARDGEKPFVPMGCLSNDSMIITGIESRAGNSGAKFQNGDTLLARITPCLENGKTGLVQFLPSTDAVGFGSTEFIVLRSRTLSPEFVYLLARGDELRGVAIKSMSGASGRQRVQEKCFADLLIVQPPGVVLDRFAAVVSPSFKLIHKLHLQIQSLRRTRDLLLPRLLSGQIDVETVENA
jgi:type I restriction enzyme S subunit